MATEKKSSIVDKLTTALKQKDDKIKKLEIEVSSLSKSLKSAQRGISIYSTEDSVKKKILELRAKNYSPVKIFDTCQYIGIDVELEAIKDIVENIDELDSEYRLYWRECVDNYEKEIKINPQILRQASLDDVQFQIDKMKEIISKADENGEDTFTVSKYMDKLDVYIKTRSTILKDVVFGEEERDNSIDILESTMEEYRENSGRLVKLAINANNINTLDNIN